jgi:hypothetical protein
MANEAAHANPGGETSPRHDTTHFEHTDINCRGTFLTGVAVLVGLWVFTGLLYFYFAFLSHYRAEMSRPPLAIEEHGTRLPPEPRLQQSPPRDYQAYLKSEEGKLDHYFWVDKAKGQVAIPIGRAMQILAQKGIPPQKAPPGLVLGNPQEGSRETGFEGKVEPEPK